MIRTLFALLVLVLCSGTAFCGETLLEQGYKDMYNLRFDEAHRVFAEYQKVEPNDPVGPVSDAAAYLFSEFDRLHILQSEFFMEGGDLLESRKRQPDNSVKTRFDADLEKTQTLAALQMQWPGDRANAMFAETLRLGLHADYLALIDKQEMAALAEMKKGRQLAQNLLSQHPDDYDAYIAVGVENYLLSRKPAPIRWFLRATGAETDKQNGLDKLKLTAEKGHYLAPYARLLLAVAALRDGNQKQARALFTWLASHYPYNNLYRDELAKLH